MDKNSKIYIAGHRGMVGSAIVRKLKSSGFENLICRTSAELDLRNQQEVDAFFAKELPEYVFLAAAKVGGIMANKTYPAEFIYDNLMISANVIHASYKYGVKKLLNLGSSCIYPKDVSLPIKECDLLTSDLEKTNEPYSIAKISAIKLCTYYNLQYKTDFISVMPTNQYGLGDNFSMEKAHLLPMIIRRCYLAKLLSEDNFDKIKRDILKTELGFGLDNKIDFDNVKTIEDALEFVGVYRDKIVMWGDGSPYRELMCSDDLADACLFLMNNRSAENIGEFVNITSGKDINVKELIERVRDIVGFSGKIEFDVTKPNGVYRKLLDATKINSLGWKPKINLDEGIKCMCQWYEEEIKDDCVR